MRSFEYDDNKSQSNLAKHGIDFVKAQELWSDRDLLEIPSKIEGETRFVVIGKINGKHWSGVITYRDQNIRIISVRRSRIQEVALYERRDERQGI
jgi:uncharacterized protein